MRILISNDDGVQAPGIAALAAEFARMGEVTVVAPERERSTTGHALTLHKPLRVHRLGSRRYSVSGGPADCIFIALGAIFKGKRPDLVLSGINRGANLGQDVFYSGTASAAREAANFGIPSLAVSLDLSYHGRKTAQKENYRTAAVAARRALEHTLRVFSPTPMKSLRGALAHWPQKMMLNVNVPNVPLTKLKGLRPATQGRRIYDTSVFRRVDTRDREYFWIGGKYRGYDPVPESDCWQVDHGYAAVTPLELDTTMTPIYQILKEGFARPPEKKLRRR